MAGPALAANCPTSGLSSLGGLSGLRSHGGYHREGVLISLSSSVWGWPSNLSPQPSSVCLAVIPGHPRFPSFIPFPPHILSPISPACLPSPLPCESLSLVYPPCVSCTSLPYSSFPCSFALLLAPPHVLCSGCFLAMSLATAITPDQMLMWPG